MANGKTGTWTGEGGLLDTDAVGLIKAIEETIRQVVYLLIGFKVVEWTEGQTGLVLSAVSAFLALGSIILSRRFVFSRRTVREEYNKKEA